MLPVAQGRGESPPPNEGGRGEFCCLFQTFSSHGGGCGGGGRGQKRYLSTSLMTRNVLYGGGRASGQLVKGVECQESSSAGQQLDGGKAAAAASPPPLSPPLSLHTS